MDKPRGEFFHTNWTTPSSLESQTPGAFRHRAFSFLPITQIMIKPVSESPDAPLTCAQKQA